MIRVITASTPSGEREEVIFTEDMDTPAEDFFIMGDMTIDIDQKVGGLPHGFPFDYTLVAKK